MDAGLIPAKLFECQVAESRPVGAYRQLALVAPEIAYLAHPGQFLMVRLAGPALDPLLPRPMCVHDIDSDLVKLLIDPVGKGTAALAGAEVGDRLSVLGPLGRGFDMEGEGLAVVVGGGIGVSPLVLLAKVLLERGREVRCVLGFRNRSQAVAAGLFPGADIDLLTEDGSAGRTGLVSEPLPGCLVREEGNPAPEIFACGPDAMLKAVARIAADCGVRAQVSMDTHMACGIGSCQGCVIPGPEAYRKTCIEGPVFDTRDLKWQ